MNTTNQIFTVSSKTNNPVFPNEDDFQKRRKGKAK